MEMELPLKILKINEFFSLDKNPIGSFERLKSLSVYLTDKPNFYYLIAGSWAIEGISGQILEHDDIDLIFLNNPSFYVDDAITKEEHCCNIIPLDTNYIKENAIKVKIRGEIEVYVPSPTLQYCLKLIGQLENELSKRAIAQSFLLLSLYANQDYHSVKEEIICLLNNLTPADFDVEVCAEDMILAIKSYRIQDLKNTEFYLRSAHRRINDSLHKKFREMNLE